MMPMDKTDFSEHDKLSTILKHPRLQNEKYGGASFKHVRIDCGRTIYEADSSYLRMLLEKYGDISFMEANQKYAEETECASR